MANIVFIALVGLAAGLNLEDPHSHKAELQHKAEEPHSHKKSSGGSASSSSSAVPEHTLSKGLKNSLDYSSLNGDGTGSAPVPRKTKCEGFIEELKVVGDGAAYVSTIYVGYKKFHCLPDTGSFDLEIIGSDAENFNGTGYDRKKSLTHRRFPIPEKENEDLMFGSGPARVRKGMDMVALVKDGEPHKNCRAPEAPIGTITKTSIRELLRDDAHRDFDAICGIGLGPKDKLQHRLVSQLGVKRVGFCFRKDISKGGIAHWNYRIKEQKARGFQFSTVNVIGPYWGMAVTKGRAEMNGESTVFACQDAPCLAVIDTGTTLHSMDSDSLHRFQKIIGDKELTCDESLFAVLPNLCYNDENGKSLCLHPQDYVFKMGAGMKFNALPSYIRQSLAFTPENLPNLLGKKEETDNECILALGDSGEKNMHVLGIQWFKRHWFGFDTVSSAISWSKHDGSCNPEKKDFHQLPSPKLQVLDLSKLSQAAISLRIKQAKKAGPEVYEKVREQIGLAEMD